MKLWKIKIEILFFLMDYNHNKKILLIKELELSYNHLYNGIKIYKIIVIIFLDYCICMETKKTFWERFWILIHVIILFVKNGFPLMAFLFSFTSKKASLYADTLSQIQNS